MDTVWTVRHRVVLSALGAVLLALPLLGPGDFQCRPIPVEPPRDTHCDDGTEPICLMVPPACEDYEILAYQNHCYECVNPDTCVPWGEPECRHDAECGVEEWCNPCGTGSCPFCEDCVAACTPHGCPTEPSPDCDAIRPDCAEGQVAVVRGGCWLCVGLDSCEPVRDEHCDDGTEPICDRIPPVCDDFEILAYQDNCYVCVNPQTCVPWGEPGCRSDADCPAAEECDPCGTSSCPVCDDCVPACVAHGCATAPEPACDMLRPDCANGQVAVVRDGCWLCVDRTTCQPPSDRRCDDGTPLECNMIEPECGFLEVAAVQEGCWVCVNEITCRPWGEPGCAVDADCPPAEYCNDCATGSCPMCLDCIAGCTIHGCPTEPEPTCRMLRPECGGVSVVRDGCWVCVGFDACEPMGAR